MCGLNTVATTRRNLYPSGEYTAEMSYGKEKMKQTFRVEIAEGIITR